MRRFYAPFESDIRSGTADVYRHEMPGGQYTNLREQARALGLEHRWTEVSQAYAEVNELFGDIVKVTPTSKVVGDMALIMVANELSAERVLDPQREIAFPESVVSLLQGRTGLPARRLSGRAVAQGAEGASRPAVPAGRSHCAGRPRAARAQRRERMRRASSTTASSPRT